jgi:hypothetical protein
MINIINGAGNFYLYNKDNKLVAFSPEGSVKITNHTRVLVKKGKLIPTFYGSPTLTVEVELTNCVFSERSFNNLDGVVSLLIKESTDSFDPIQDTKDIKGDFNNLTLTLVNEITGEIKGYQVVENSYIG